MLDALSNLLAPPVLERLTLVLNHVLRSEAVATERLRPHSGRTVTLSLAGWPALLPAPPALAWRVSAAGLLEWCGLPGGPGPGETPAPDLRVTIDAANPAALFARALAGERPAVQVEGDAAFAADIGWLLQNLRWDVAADLERLFGPVLAQQLHELARALARGLRSALDTASTSPWAGRLAEFSSRFAPGGR